MSKYNQIIDEVYDKYKTHIQQQRDDQKIEVQRLRSQGKRVKVARIILLNKEDFINKCKTDQDFSERWGLTIEEHELSEERRYNIWFNNNYETGMERFFNPEQLPDYDNPYYEPTPKKEITVFYHQYKINFYE